MRRKLAKDQKHQFWWIILKFCVYSCVCKLTTDSRCSILWNRVFFVYCCNYAKIRLIQSFADVLWNIEVSLSNKYLLKRCKDVWKGWRLSLKAKYRGGRPKLFYELAGLRNFIKFTVLYSLRLQVYVNYSSKKPIKHTVQKRKFSVKDFFSNFDQIHSFLRIWWYLLTKSLMDNFIFCAKTSPNDCSNFANPISAYKIYVPNQLWFVFAWVEHWPWRV